MLHKMAEPSALSTGADQFRWHPASDVVLRGTRLDFEQGPNSDDTIERTLHQLHQALKSQQGFRLSDSGIELLPLIGANRLQCMTSGTTGPAKIIDRSPASWIASFAHNATQFGLSPKSSFAVLGHLSHSLSFYGVMEALYLGADIHVLAGLRPDRQITQIVDHQISLIYATPTQLRTLCDAGGHHPAIPSLQHILCGGGAMPSPLKPQLEKIFPTARLVEFYGASETSFITMADAATPAGSVGKAYGAARLEIRDAQGAPTKSVGEVWVKSPYLFDGYATGNSTQTRWSDDGFLTVGELGLIDDAGYLFLKGRGDRMITIADQNVYPEEIEALISNDSGVARCCVLPVEDNKRGHSFVAVIESGENQQKADDLLAMLRGQLGPLKAPRQILFHPNFPLRTGGKPDLMRLQAWVDQQK